MSEYRAVLKYATKEKEIITFKSDWVSEKETAKEVVEESKPFMNRFGGWFDGYIESKGRELL